ncbi:hypothetical protein HanRHA438_Chr09g0419971 [Helianthus annuus]|nr:hypothetical protein HanOQP8_Chr09g0339581 [Helianthus annuus]KAJ0890098.1 hypothetical protein HanRHA438_Chr09g0419971 [Helianthus annuus]KAJ0894865.1 hypothetical protein HanPSC8_Chr09g0393771 [Helianthus annuus]
MTGSSVCFCSGCFRDISCVISWCYCAYFGCVKCFMLRLLKSLCSRRVRVVIITIVLFFTVVLGSVWLILLGVVNKLLVQC